MQCGTDNDRAVVIRAHGKVNLCLAVGAPVADGERAGWHPICSWMHAIELADTVEVRALTSGPSTLEIRWADDAPRPSPIDWALESDLAYRAHALLEEHVGRALAVSARVTKRVPVGGGLGGGSSDAAAMLRALDDLFSLGLGAETLRQIGMRLGSDVGFFIDADDPPGAAIVGGFGERVERVERTPGEIALLVPGFGCATGAVYRSFDACGATALDEGAVRSAHGAARAGSASWELLFNDLAVAAERVEPRLARARAECAEILNRRVHITGSGSTMFTLGRVDEGLSGRLMDEAGIRVVNTRLI